MKGKSNLMAWRIASRPWLLVIVMLIAASAIAMVFVLKRMFENNRWTRITVAQVDSDIKEHVPSRSSREQIAAYLDAHKIAHHFYSSDLYHNTAYQNCEVALVPHTASSGLITTDIQIIFRFNSEMKLVSYDVREINKGP